MTPHARRIAVLIAFVVATAAQVATAAPEFYSNLLRRGISEFNAGRYASATALLRNAAFGFLDAIDQYETAQAYVAVASQRLGRDEEARHATRRILMAERVQRRFAALPLPPELRTQFEGVAARYLTSGEHAALFDATAEVPQRPFATSVRRRTIEPAPTPALESKSPPQAAPAVVAEPTAVSEPSASEPIAKAVPAEPSIDAAPQPAPAPVVPTEAPEEREPHNLVVETPVPTDAAPEPTVDRPVVPEEPVRAEPVPAEPGAVEAVPPTVVEPEAGSVARLEPAAKQQPVEEPPQPESKEQAAPTEPAPAAAQPEPAAPEPAVPAVSVPIPVPPAPTPSAPSAEAVREAQREFERKVAEVERSEPAPTGRNASAREVGRTLEEAAAALDRDDILGARAKLRDAFAVTNLRREDVLKIAEEAYRARDFSLSVDAFARAGALGRGEEALGYYLAVALYETGKYGEAKAALAAALPHIEVTDVVARYRAKIEGAVE